MLANVHVFKNVLSQSRRRHRGRFSESHMIWKRNENHAWKALGTHAPVSGSRGVLEAPSALTRAWAVLVGSKDVLSGGRS